MLAFIHLGKGEEEGTDHLIRQNPIQPIIIQTDHPLQALELVLLQRPADQDRRLPRHLLADPVRDGVVVHLVARDRVGRVLGINDRAERRLVRWALYSGIL